MPMYYVLDISEKYPDSHWLNYDHQNSPDHLLFKSGKKVTDPLSEIKFTLNGANHLNSLQKFDVLFSDGPILFSSKLACLVDEISPNDVQFFPALIKTEEKDLIGYKVANIINAVPCIDLQNSDYRPLLRSHPNGPLKFKRYEFLPNSLGTHNIVRAKEKLETIVASEQFRIACKENKIFGFDFLENGERRY